MAGRKNKVGLDFFKLDCVLDEKFEYFEADRGLLGFGIIIKLFQKIYGERGYYIEYNDKYAAILAKRFGTGKSAVQEAVESAVREGIFDREMFEKHGILTSHGIQKAYLGAVSRRTFFEIKPEYALVDYTQISISANINEINVDRNEENEDTNEQRKEESNNKDLILSSLRQQELKVVKLSSEEIARLEAEIDGALLMKYIKIVADCERDGKRFTKKSHCDAILDMARNDGNTREQLKKKSRPKKTAKQWTGTKPTEEDTLQMIRGTLGKGVVYLSSRQLDNLVNILGLDAFNRYVDRLSTYIIEENAYVKNHYETILKWHEEDSRV